MEFTTKQMMLHIKTIDKDAYIGLSQFTGSWYVHVDLNRGGDGCLTGISQHGHSPEAAVENTFNVLITIAGTDYIVGSMGEDRRHYRWNGVAFQEQPIYERQLS